MVRGNWQKRVERAEERRKESKQKKANRNSKGLYKNLVLNQLWPFLNDIPMHSIISNGVNNNNNNYNEKNHENLDTGPRKSKDTDKHNHNYSYNISPSYIMHLWVDCPPLSKQKTYHKKGIDDDITYNDKNNYNINDNDDNNDNNNNGYASSGSSCTSKKRKSKREIKKHPKHVSHTGGTPNTNKKVHPRSHEHMSTPDKIGGGGSNVPSITHEDDDLLLCASYFFQGKCQNHHPKSNKKSSSNMQCPFYHYKKSKLQHTLNDILSNRDNVDCRRSSNNGNSHYCKILNHSLNSAVSAFAQLTGNSLENDENMNQNVHMLYYLDIDFEKFHFDKDRHTKMSDIVSEVIATEACPISSIVYIAINNTLVFDRYNGGIVVPKEQFGHLRNQNEQRRKMSLDFISGAEDYEEVDFTLLPVAVLEHILTFLPDEASGQLPMVCKAWYSDIGKTSPALWQHLHSRKKWPTKLLSEDKDISALTSEIKELFVSHKVMCKAIETFIKGIECIQSGNTGTKPQNTLALQLFKDSKETMNKITSIHHWDELSMIAACRKDCTLNIYNPVRSDESSIGLHCKHLLGIRVAPFPISKKNTCKLQSFDLSDEFILCSYDVLGVTDWLVAIKRDDLLLNSAESILDENSLKKYDTSDLYNDFVGSTKSFDEVMLNHMITDIPDLTVCIVSDIVGCNGGNFVFIIAIHSSIEEDNQVIAGAIVQFSVRSECFTFCKHFEIEGTTAVENQLSLFDKDTNSIVYCCGLSKPVVILNAERKLGVTMVHEYQSASDCIKEYMLHNELEKKVSSPKMFSISTRSHLVLASVVIDNQEKAKVVLFCYRKEFYNEINFIIVLDGLQDIVSIHNCGDYIIIMCEGPDVDHDQIDGHWFGLEETESQKVMFVSLIHIPTKTEIYRFGCSEKSCDLSDVKLAVGVCESPFILACKGKEGVVVSGEILRDIEVESQHLKVKSSSKPTKIKKKKKTLKKNKKDAFARGMSLRG